MGGVTKEGGIMNIIRQLFCHHDWEVCRRIESGFACISGEQLYRRCTKCGKVEKWIWREYEGNGYR